MKKTSIALFLAMLMVLSFVGCQPATSTKSVTLKVYNWGEYIDRTVLQDFEKKTGIKIIYDTFATNEDMYAKIKAGGSDYDVTFPSDYMIKKMANEGMLEKLDYANIPNYKYIDKKFQNMAYDAKNEVSIPYMWGTVGILYNKKTIKEPVDSWNILWDKKYAKQIFMLDSSRDSIGITLKKLGFNLNSKDPKELEQAKNALIEQKPLVLSYLGDEVKDKMIGNEAVFAVVWSGIAALCMAENPDLDYVIPKEGSNWWVDGVVVLKGTKHKKEAEMFINYLCDTDVALKNAIEIKYSSPQTEVFKKLDEATKTNHVIYPTDAELKRCEVFDDLANVIKQYDEMWTEIKAK